MCHPQIEGVFLIAPLRPCQVPRAEIAVKHDLGVWNFPSGTLRVVVDHLLFIYGLEGWEIKVIWLRALRITPFALATNPRAFFSTGRAMWPLREVSETSARFDSLRVFNFTFTEIVIIGSVLLRVLFFN